MVTKFSLLQRAHTAHSNEEYSKIKYTQIVKNEKGILRSIVGYGRSLKRFWVTEDVDWKAGMEKKGLHEDYSSTYLGDGVGGEGNSVLLDWELNILRFCWKGWNIHISINFAVSVCRDKNKWIHDLGGLLPAGIWTFQIGTKLPDSAAK